MDFKTPNLHRSDSLIVTRRAVVMITTSYKPALADYNQVNQYRINRVLLPPLLNHFCVKKKQN